MELGAEINQKVKKTIKKQLQALDCYVDDELPEYIMVMIANKRNEKEMVDDLTLFLGAEAEKFVSWLLVVLGRIKKAMELPDITEINNGESKKKLKKSGECSSDEKHKKSNLKDKRKFREEKCEGDKIKKDKPNEKSEIEVGNKIMEKNDRNDVESLRKDKEKHKDKRREWQNEKEKVVDRTKIQKKENESEKKEEKKKDIKKEKNVLNRKEKKEGKVEKAKAKVEDDDSSEKAKISKTQKIDKSLKKKTNLEKLIAKEKSIDDSEDIRINAEAEARRIEQRTDRRSNPMEFVKKIAYDINKRLNVSETTVEKNEVENILEKSNEKPLNNKNKTPGGALNDSLHAVSQYEDRDVETKKNKSNEKLSSNQRSLSQSKKEKNRSVSRTRTRSRSRSRSRTRSRTRYTNRLVNEQNLTKRKDRSRSRSFKRNFKSRGRSRSNSLHKTTRRINKGRSRSNSLHRTKRRSFRSRSPKRNKSHSRSPHKDTKKHRSNSPHCSRRHSKSISPQRRVYNKDNKKTSTHKSKDEKSDKVQKDKSNDVINKKYESSKDSKRRPNIHRDHQASSVLLKKAMAEVVVKKPLVDIKVTDNEEEGNSDNNMDREKIIKNTYDENIEKVLHVKSNEDITSDSHSRDRRVINIDESQITVCFNVNDSDNRIKSKGSGKELDKDETNDKNGISKYDARYAILKSRDQNNKQLDKYSRSNTIKESKKKEYAGSMVADIEEQARKQQRYTQRKILRNNKRHSEGKSSYTHKRVGEDSSESDSQTHTNVLKTETRRIELQEISRHLKPTVDLRELLKRDKPLSDDEDILARKLRQKLKEEKHKRLFGKLAPGEETILKEERMHLRKELKKRTIQKKITKQPVLETLIVDKKREDNAEDEFSDEWVENQQAENNINESDNENKQRKFNKKNQKIKCKNEGYSYNDDDTNKEFSVDNEAENLDGNNDIESEIKDNEIQIHLERVKHEFIVTLDGIDVSRHLSGNTESSPKHHSRQHQKESRDRKESSSFTQSDEEFEEIMKKKDKESEQLERNKRKHRESRHSYNRRRKLSDSVELELELAEQKLKAQKLLRKSLKQVQNLDTKMLIEKTKHKTFINPHFQPKIPIIDNVSSPLNNFCLLPTLHLVVPPSPTVETNTLNEVKETIDTNIPNMKYSCDTKEPITSNAAPSLVNSSETTNVKVTVEESSFPEQKNRTIQERCVYWPSCKNSFCKYVHPSIPCKAFPKCSFGDRCLYVHPICKFGERCNVADCQYMHSKSLPLMPGSQQICNFGLNCSKSDCSFKHPIPMPCRYGNLCKNRDCLYTHEKPATGSSLKWTAGKLHISERSFAVDDSKVTETPIAITLN
ncbi:trichohyalin isoform X4 [Hydra vulgaris]|uniref:Zinc finger CCCH domain-containing protein 14 n=1 Tax=Hydra vulgaris TaxID=6087 RepID=A0ABM4C1G8_HYDVU